MKIKVKFSFLVFNALLFMFRDSGLILAFYVACISHELGHIAAIKLTGSELKSLELSCSGIKMTATPSSSIKKGVFVLLSGVAVNFLTYGILKIIGVNGYLTYFSLAEGLFNLLPYSMLDGGAVLDLLAEGSIYEEQAKICYMILRVSLAVIFFAFLIFSLAKKYFGV